MKNLIRIVKAILALFSSRKGTPPRSEFTNVSFLIQILNEGGQLVEGTVVSNNHPMGRAISMQATEINVTLQSENEVQVNEHNSIKFYIMNLNGIDLKKIRIQLHPLTQTNGCDGTSSTRQLNGIVCNGNNYPLMGVQVSVGMVVTHTISDGGYSHCFPCTAHTNNIKIQNVEYKKINNRNVIIKLEKSGTPETTIDVFMDDSPFIPPK